MAIKTDGTLWGWGENFYGELGAGTNIRKNVPTLITSNIGWLTVSGGHHHTIAIKTDGTLWAWGLNGGQLGDGTILDKNSPTHIGSSTNWKEVSAGIYHSIALKSDGSLWAWGNNSFGQLGDGTSILKTSPTLVGTTSNWAKISSGDYHTSAIKTDGSLWTWGANINGTLGNGTFTDSYIPYAFNCPALGIPVLSADELAVNVYPNPTSDFLNINYKLLHNSHVIIRVVNSQGRLISEYQTEKKSGSNSDKIVLQNQPAGLYFLTFSANGQSQTIKIEKNPSF